MTSARRNYPLTALLAAALLLGLTACGVKGPLEPPPAPKMKSSDTDTPDPARPRISMEKSSVQTAPSTSILPQMPPKEWEKLGQRQQPAPSQSGKRQGPDEPFILDPLL